MVDIIITKLLAVVYLLNNIWLTPRPAAILLAAACDAAMGALLVVFSWTAGLLFKTPAVVRAGWPGGRFSNFSLFSAGCQIISETDNSFSPLQNANNRPAIITMARAVVVGARSSGIFSPRSQPEAIFII